MICTLYVNAKWQKYYLVMRHRKIAGEKLVTTLISEGVCINIFIVIKFHLVKRNSRHKHGRVEVIA